MKEVSSTLDDVLAYGKREADKFSEGESVFLEEVYSFVLDWKRAENQLSRMLYEKEEAMMLYIESDRNKALGSVRLRANIVQVNHTLQKDFF
ncbi:bifunctional ATP-dependent DNA helicase/DNA polymerase III subunit epsilon [Listeria rocourtiae FSL F6-920]|nr:hypothetical protein [Listeria rocourtiae]EUJ49407.1 bifunctional ATP-dependent DNA helicase/DNA polymerase III subunit epsilon [Listeria rocourtiae FSL F6-920]